ncbi:7656_t:CDS:2, partial [Racocetra persica]
KRRNLLSDSQEHQDLIKEQESMEKGLEEKSRTIEKLSESREKLKKRDYIGSQNFQGWIKKGKQDLERKKNELERNAELRELEKEGTKRGFDYFKEKIESLLESQVKITRYKDVLLKEKNKDLLAELSEFFDADKLNDLCDLQNEITKNKPLNLEELPLKLYDTTGNIDESEPGGTLSSGGKKSLLKAVE